jgi:hypothetical protein
MATQNAGTLLGIYLNDHLAGATGGRDLAKRIAETNSDWEHASELRRLALEIDQDRAALLEIMGVLRVEIQHYKLWAAWFAEKAGRLKPNGYLLRRSPVSRLIELETMRLGVEGKAAGWRTLREAAETDRRLDRQRLDQLLERAREQSDTLERLRVAAARELVL